MCMTYTLQPFLISIHLESKRMQIVARVDYSTPL